LFSGSELSKQKSSGASTEKEQPAVLVFPQHYMMNTHQLNRT
jgi:hypothetical protein